MNFTNLLIMNECKHPILNFDFFNLVHKYKDALCPVIFFAELEGNKIAGSLCFQSKDTFMEDIGAHQ